MKRTGLILLAVAATLAAHGSLRWGQPAWHRLYLALRGRRTLDEALAQYGPAARQRLRCRFESAGVPYPPERLALLAFKAERRLELWAPASGRWAHVHCYHILAASGRAGPKLREGDRQVPEGAYRILALNPNSSYHLSMELDYPNSFDRRKARQEGRSDLGGDIFIHGKALSIGCLAVGDEAIEELFVLAARVGTANVRVLIAPNDLRLSPPPRSSALPPWADELYESLSAELARFRR